MKRSHKGALLAFLSLIMIVLSGCQFVQNGTFSSIDNNPTTVKREVANMHHYKKTLLVLNLKGCKDCKRVEKPTVQEIYRLKHQEVHVVAYDVGAMSKQDREYLKNNVPGVRVGNYIETPSFIELKPNGKNLMSVAEQHGGSTKEILKFLKEVKPE